MSSPRESGSIGRSSCSSASSVHSHSTSSVMLHLPWEGVISVSQILSLRKQWKQQQKLAPSKSGSRPDQHRDKTHFHTKHSHRTAKCLSQASSASSHRNTLVHSQGTLHDSPSCSSRQEDRREEKMGCIHSSESKDEDRREDGSEEVSYLTRQVLGKLTRKYSNRLDNKNKKNRSDKRDGFSSCESGSAVTLVRTGCSQGLSASKARLVVNTTTKGRSIQSKSRTSRTSTSSVSTIDSNCTILQPNPLRVLSLLPHNTAKVPSTSWSVHCPTDSLIIEKQTSSSSSCITISSTAQQQPHYLQPVPNIHRSHSASVPRILYDPSNEDIVETPKYTEADICPTGTTATPTTPLTPNTPFPSKSLDGGCSSVNLRTACSDAVESKDFLSSVERKGLQNNTLQVTNDPGVWALSYSLPSSMSHRESDYSLRSSIKEDMVSHVQPLKLPNRVFLMPTRSELLDASSSIPLSSASPSSASQSRSSPSSPSSISRSHKIPLNDMTVLTSPALVSQCTTSASSPLAAVQSCVRGSSNTLSQPLLRHNLREEVPHTDVPSTCAIEFPSSPVLCFSDAHSQTSISATNIVDNMPSSHSLLTVATSLQPDSTSLSETQGTSNGGSSGSFAGRDALAPTSCNERGKEDMNCLPPSSSADIAKEGSKELLKEASRTQTLEAADCCLLAAYGQPVSTWTEPSAAVTATGSIANGAMKEHIETQRVTGTRGSASSCSLDVRVDEAAASVPQSKESQVGLQRTDYEETAAADDGQVSLRRNSRDSIDGYSARTPSFGCGSSISSRSSWSSRSNVYSCSQIQSIPKISHSPCSLLPVVPCPTNTAGPRQLISSASLTQIQDRFLSECCNSGGNSMSLGTLLSSGDSTFLDDEEVPLPPPHSCSPVVTPCPVSDSIFSSVRCLASAPKNSAYPSGRLFDELDNILPQNNTYLLSSASCSDTTSDPLAVTQHSQQATTLLGNEPEISPVESFSSSVVEAQAALSASGDRAAPSAALQPFTACCYSADDPSPILSQTSAGLNTVSPVGMPLTTSMLASCDEESLLLDTRQVPRKSVGSPWGLIEVTADGEFRYAIHVKDELFDLCPLDKLPRLQVTSPGSLQKTITNPSQNSTHVTGGSQYTLPATAPLAESQPSLRASESCLTDSLAGQVTNAANSLKDRTRLSDGGLGHTDESTQEATTQLWFVVEAGGRYVRIEVPDCGTVLKRFAFRNLPERHQARYEYGRQLVDLVFRKHTPRVVIKQKRSGVYRLMSNASIGDFVAVFGSRFPCSSVIKRIGISTSTAAFTVTSAKGKTTSINLKDFIKAILQVDITLIPSQAPSCTMLKNKPIDLPQAGLFCSYSNNSSSSCSSGNEKRNCSMYYSCNPMLSVCGPHSSNVALGTATDLHSVLLNATTPFTYFSESGTALESANGEQNVFLHNVNNGLGESMPWHVLLSSCTTAIVFYRQAVHLFENSQNRFEQLKRELKAVCDGPEDNNGEVGEWDDSCETEDYSHAQTDWQCQDGSCNIGSRRHTDGPQGGKRSVTTIHNREQLLYNECFPVMAEL
eukprot:GHVQ01000264.1.p1 GENE.GHVQ01000264.1~~GHVQ01000264.1.p1  ORF type:complete len:1545 (-),score=208.89 GHVQ01000264.1:370-5004(-)